ncbi:MAG: ribosome silencing factor [Saprospiraceae bacterium]|nr:ribosome silencing factor [Saprospiraceae bacterium]
MSAQAVLKTSPSYVEELNDIIIDSIQDIKGKNIVKLDLRKLDDAPTDFFIICEGDSTTQVKAIAGNIHKRLKDELGQAPYHMEGVQTARWICIDCFNTVVHVFYREAREFYDIENLWSDAKFTEYENL